MVEQAVGGVASRFDGRWSRTRHCHERKHEITVMYGYVRPSIINFGLTLLLPSPSVSTRGWLAPPGGHFATLYTHIDDLTDRCDGDQRREAVPTIPGLVPRPRKLTEAWMRLHTVREVTKPGATIAGRRGRRAPGRRHGLYPANAVLGRALLSRPLAGLLASEPADHPIELGCTGRWRSPNTAARQISAT